MVLSSLTTVPRHSSREVLVIYASITTSDEGVTGLPGGLLDEPNGTLGRLKKAGVKVHVICCSSEVRAARVIAESTGGTFHVPLNSLHLHRVLSSLVKPPPNLSSSVKGRMVEYGFPQLVVNDVKTMVGGVMGREGYKCPRCRHMARDVPCTCDVCGLRLILATNLAKSYHHLFPPGQAVEVDDVEEGEGA